jgi:hypothetical protein
LWKEIAVVPVFKKGNSTNVKNYRPIYILNNFLNYFNLLFITTYLTFSTINSILLNMVFVNSIRLQSFWLHTLILLCPLFALNVK